MVQDLDDIVDINITTPNDADSAVGGAVACRNDGGSEELAASDPRSTLGQIDNSSLCEADVPPSAGKKVGYLEFLLSCIIYTLPCPLAKHMSVLACVHTHTHTHTHTRRHSIFNSR